MSDLIKRDDALALLDLIAGGEEYIDDRERLVAALPAIDPAAIREAALREAAMVCINVSNDVWTQIGREHAPFMKATAEDCSKMILALIGETK